MHRSQSMPWYTGPTLLEHLETVPVAEDVNLRDFRFPVQYVMRPDLDYRGFSGTIASGMVKQGDTIHGAAVGQDHAHRRHRHLRAARWKAPTRRWRSRCV
ncbi:MAG: hypothetical protein QM756_06015 [Polyangiaceae bacterium]